MTIAEGKQKVVSLALDQVGTKEGANNWNPYAEDPRITRLYGWNVQNQPWCCTFVSWLFMEAFGEEIGSRIAYGGSAACATSASLYSQAGAWYQSPEVGDQIFFYYGGINHTGIVVAVEGNTVITVEGNSSDKVSRCSYVRGSPKIAGYGRPNWKLVTGEDPGEMEQPKETEKKKQKLELPTIRTGSKGIPVKLCQAALYQRGYVLQVDGDFGQETWKTVLAFQQDAGLEQDAVVGPKTWKKLLKVG